MAAPSLTSSAAGNDLRLPEQVIGAAAARRLTDSHGRVIHDLRVSVTDRCNYKCIYCRTGEYGAQYP